MASERDGSRDSGSGRALTTRRVGLAEAFELLPRPRGSAGLPAFATAVVSGGFHRLGKDAQGSAALILVTEEQAPAARSVPLELEHLVIQHAVPCLIWKEDGTSEESTFTLIRCREADRVLNRLFPRRGRLSFPALGFAPSQARVQEVVGHLVDSSGPYRRRAARRSRASGRSFFDRPGVGTARSCPGMAL